ncbi:hypothetical protein SLS53_006301 [Cytospora paraplurivora]|uniref:DUF1711 domain-containing protein n=1 Tax=Cytospora paraplurivora TaxID=2898453 RepID=A0AAN9U3G9_9PEZI
MAPSSKAAGSGKDRRKSSSATSRLVVLKVSPDRLRTLLKPESDAVPLVTKDDTEDTPMKDVKDSPSDSTSLPPAAATNPEIATEVATDSNPATPANGGTPVPSVMGPPGEGQGPKKKGVKRSATAANGDSSAKIRGKPGPKKRQRMDDGTLEPRAAAHRLGPKANQGAINAGLRALDRSGKPCRKWAKGGFQLKTFTGVQWEIPRWTAPPKPKPVEVTPEEGVTASGPVSADGSSSKENKELVAQPVKSDSNTNSVSGGDVEMQSAPSIQASSPAPMPIAAGA